MLATVNAKRCYMRSDGRFFVAADALSGEFDRGDLLLVPVSDATELRLAIDRIYFVATNLGAQQSLVFKGLEPETTALVDRAIGDGCVLTIAAQMG